MTGLTTHAAWVEQVKREHRQLHELLTATDRQIALAAGGAPASGADRELVHLLRKQMGELGEFLKRHFEQEECGGCLEEAVAQAPRLGARADAVMREHRVLLGHVERLTEQVRTPLNGQALQRTYAQFRRELTEHEAAEVALLAAAFNCTPESLDPA